MKRMIYRKRISLKSIFSLLIILCFLNFASAQNPRPVWSKSKAKSWYAKQGWLRGSDFIPSTAINQLEMWQAETFDTATIARELGFAQSIGFNCMRVFLHHLAWEQDSIGFLNRMDQYLGIANAKGIKTMFVFFDDCWNESYHAGKQPDPKPGVHNSGWLRDPGKLIYDDPGLMTLLEVYVKDVMTHFKDDDRILLWDMYNEPGNSDYKEKSLPLLKNAFLWGQEVNPSQPLSACIWSVEIYGITHFEMTHSDVITYHNYDAEKEHQHAIDTLTKYGRPLICTEYMARLHNSTFFNIMPILKKANVGAINWGLVAGKTNTMFAWDTPIPDGKEPKVWFHDIFRPNGTPFSNKEVEFIRELTGVKSTTRN